MSDPSVFILSFIIFLPAVAAVVLMFFPREAVEAIRGYTLAITVAVFLSTLWLALPGSSPVQFDVDQPAMQNAFSIAWIPSFDIYYFLGFDGISFPLVVLTSFICLLAMVASWTITKHVKTYCVLFLLLETGMLGVFLALDFFLFYVFWEVTLLPMYFLIGVWGGPRKEYAAIKFFLYTLLGSVLMLVALLMVYFAGDLTTLANAWGLNERTIAQSAAWQELHLHPQVTDQVARRLSNQAIGINGPPVHTFNMLALAAMGQHTNLFDGELLFGLNLQWWAFVLLFIGFVIKVPSVPVHTWLPDAHVEAPTPISMILAGVLLKMGGYGIIRICYPICPDAGFDLRWIICAIGVLSMVYGAFAALAQTDFKRMVAYSSVSHMGYVVLGLGVWSAAAGNLFNGDYWNMGIKGAMFQMIAHGISSAGMFFMVGVVYDRVHHRDLNKFGGLFGKMPLYTGLSIVIFFAALGLPGLCGFIGEVFVVLSVWKFSQILAVISAFVVILTAAYILWALQRVYLGHEYKGPHPEALLPMNVRELSVAVPLAVLAVVLGVFPMTILRYMDRTIDRQVNQLVRWTEEVKEPRLRAAAEEEAGTATDAFGQQPTKQATPAPSLTNESDAGRSSAQPTENDPNNSTAAIADPHVRFTSAGVFPARTE